MQLPSGITSAPLSVLSLSLLFVGQAAIADDVAAQAEGKPSVLDRRLAQVLQPLCKTHAGDVGVAVKVLDSNRNLVGKFQFQADRVMPTASLIKLPIMVEFYNQADAGKISLDETLRLGDADKVPGSGILTDHFSAGAQLPVEDVVRLMIRYSDNTATNMVLDRVGLGSTAATMKQLGYPETQPHSKVYRRDTSIAPERSKKYGLGSTTADEMVDLLLQLETGKIGSKTSRERMFGHLASCDDATKLGRFLPAEAKLSHKTGAVTRVRTDAGKISYGDHAILVAVLTANNKDTRWADDNAAEILCGRIGRAIVDAIELPKSKQKTTEMVASGSTGFLVEALQRTLNARAQAGLSVDGDFGPATQAAVIAFQMSNKIDATGIVGSQTWKALGKLITEDAPVAAPDAVNAEELSLSSALDPSAPPEVTAKAWSAFDLSGGRRLGAKDGDRRLPIASTTKVMTAYVVLKWAREQPECLDEVLVFSKNADETMGSTSGVRAGERLSVREAMYGLMLPSGNDASVALAEHFGERISQSSKELNQKEAYLAFVESMNRQARRLGMANSSFTNTHGLTEATHLSSANDLVKLTRAFLKLPLARQVCSCRQRGCELSSAEGYTRNVLWTNTNRLLGQEGFFGVKTGTTSAAGACLISLSNIGGTERIVVTLGSINSDARYVDARNLHAWAARQ